MRFHLVEGVPCFEREEVCENTQCRYFERMKGDALQLFGNCTLRVANEGPHTLNEVSAILGVSKERVRQIEAQALRKLAFRATSEGLDFETRTLVNEVLGDVLRWPPRTLNAEKLKPERGDPMAYIRLGDDVFLEFVKEEYRKVLSERVACPRMSLVVRLASCLLCRFKSKCIMIDQKWRNADPRKYYKENIASVSELYDKVKASTSEVKRKKLEEIREVANRHPDWTVSQVAHFLGCSVSYTRKVLKGDVG